MDYGDPLQKAGFQAGDTEGFLKGLTVDGHAFMGSDAVTIKVKKKKRRRGHRDDDDDDDDDD